MLSLNEAVARILADVCPTTGVARVALADAPGRYLAAEMLARVDNPAFDNSAMDGYALNSADLAAHGATLPLRGVASAGSVPARLAHGTAMRIYTGAPLPVGADTVVMQEDAQVEEDRVTVPPDTRAGAHIRRCGEDFCTGDVLYRPGHRLSVYDIALLSAAGVAELPVYARARALVIATGDELVAPGQPLAPGQIYESNRIATLLQLRALGVDAVDGGTVRDDPQALRARLQRLDDYDFIITSGGASVGDRDLVKQIFGELGQINFWKARIKPGKPVAFGRVGERSHFFALPGNPVSSLVTFKLFVEPALAAWHHGKHQLPELRATSVNAFRREPGRLEFLRARLRTEAGELRAECLPGQGSHMLGPIRDTNGFIKIAEDSSGFAAGERVTVVPLSLDLA